MQPFQNNRTTNATDLFEAGQRAIQARFDSQPPNTTKAYRNPQRAWAAFCASRQFEDGDLVYEDKACLWLETDVFLRRVQPKKKKKKKTTHVLGKRKRAAAAEVAIGPEEMALASALEIPIEELPAMIRDDRMEPEPEQEQEEEEAGGLLKWGTIEVYVAAIAELFSVQKSSGLLANHVFRGPKLAGLLDARRRQTDQHSRESFRDQAEGGISAGYMMKEFLAMQSLLLQGTPAKPQNLRTRLDTLLGHYLVLRGQLRRVAELCDLSLLELPASEGPTPCYALILQTSNGKVNMDGKKQYMGALRHKDPLLCTMGALAQYLYWRWHMSGEQPPSFRDRRAWYEIKVLAGRDKEEQLSYATQNEEVWKAFSLAGISSTQKVHVMRGYGAREQELHGVLEAQIQRAGKCDQSAMANAYLTGLPLKFLREAAGFALAEGSYHLPRAAHVPSILLQQQVWPWVEHWEARFQMRAQKKRWRDGGLDADDVAGEGFIQLLKHLRVVLLQDLAILQPQLPGLPHFSQPLFTAHTDWPAFALLVQRGVAAGEVEGARSDLLQQVAPELSNALYTSHQAILQQQLKLHGQLQAQLDHMQASLYAFLRGDIPLTVQSTIHFEGGAGPGHAALATATASTTATASAAQQPLSKGAAPGTAPPPYTLLDLRTVADVWREWKEGIGGRPAVEGLENQWGVRWRPEGRQRTAFCRRKVIVDEIAYLVMQGLPTEAAIRRLDDLRAGGSLNRLHRLIKEGRSRQQQL